MSWWDDGSALANSLIGYWKLDEASGDGIASVGSDTLLAVNAPDNAAGLIYPTARSFNGTSQRFRVADNARVSVGNIDFFVGAWCYRTASAAVYNIASQYNNTANQRAWRLIYDNTLGRYQFWASPDGVTPTTLTADNQAVAPPINNWDFVLAWHDATANTLNISVNAYVPDTMAYSTSGVFDSTEEFMVGAQGTTTLNTPGFWWTGRLGPVFFGKGYIPTIQDRHVMFYESHPTSREFMQSDTFIPPPGVDLADVYVWGAGGGGSGGSAGDTDSGGGGGGGGAHSHRLGVAVTPGSSYTVTVGVGGPTNTAGGESTVTTDGSVVTSAVGGGTTVNSPSGGVGGAAASGNGDVKTSGGSQGGAGAQSGTLRGGGGGSGSGGLTGNGVAGSAGTPGAGGGGGGAGAGGDLASTGRGGGIGGRGGNQGNNNGLSAGGWYGAGGGGSGGNVNVGGTGGPGAIVFEWVNPTYSGSITMHHIRMRRAA